MPLLLLLPLLPLLPLLVLLLLLRLLLFSPRPQLPLLAPRLRLQLRLRLRLRLLLTLTAVPLLLPQPQQRQTASTTAGSSSLASSDRHRTSAIQNLCTRIGALAVNRILTEVVEVLRGSTAMVVILLVAVNVVGAIVMVVVVLHCVRSCGPGHHARPGRTQAACKQLRLNRASMASIGLSGALLSSTKKD